MQVKLVCNDLVALARSRPDRFSGNQLSDVRECPLEGRFPASEAGQKLPFGAGHLIALKSFECRIQLSGRTEERHSRRVANFCVFTQPGSQAASRAFETAQWVAIDESWSIIATIVDIASPARRVGRLRSS
jgi:hypothetical protein